MGKTRTSRADRLKPPAKSRSEKYWTGQHWQQRRKWHQDPDVFRYPDARSEFERDLPRLIREDVLPGHVPEQPPLQPGDRVVTMGSCFARELRDHLTRRGFASGNIWIPSGLNNTFAILDFVSWCVTGSESGAGFRYDRDEEGDIREWLPVETREAYERRLAEAGAFVFTFGLAEIWQDRETKGVFWRGIPQELYKADRHEFRREHTCTAAEPALRCCNTASVRSECQLPWAASNQRDEDEPPCDLQRLLHFQQDP